MALLTYNERFVSWLFINNRGNDALMFTRYPAFANFPKPAITVTSPDGGPNNCTLKLEHTQDGEDRHPILEWKLPEGLTADVAAGQGEGKTRVYEYLVICEDADLPIPRWFAKVSEFSSRCPGLCPVSCPNGSLALLCQVWISILLFSKIKGTRRRKRMRRKKKKEKDEEKEESPHQC